MGVYGFVSMGLVLKVGNEGIESNYSISTKSAQIIIGIVL
jgi:hypothetical protein